MVLFTKQDDVPVVAPQRFLLNVILLIVFLVCTHQVITYLLADLKE